MCVWAWVCYLFWQWRKCLRNEKWKNNNFQQTVHFCHYCVVRSYFARPQHLLGGLLASVSWHLHGERSGQHKMLPSKVLTRGYRDTCTLSTIRLLQLITKLEVWLRLENELWTLWKQLLLSFDQTPYIGQLRRHMPLWHRASISIHCCSGEGGISGHWTRSQTSGYTSPVALTLTTGVARFHPEDILTPFEKYRNDRQIGDWREGGTPQYYYRRPSLLALSTIIEGQVFQQ